MSNTGFVIWSDLNNIGFGVQVDKKDYDKAKELAIEGFRRWNAPEEYPQYHDVGFAEPTEELLKEAGIEFNIFNFVGGIDYEFCGIEVVVF